MRKRIVIWAFLVEGMITTLLQAQILWDRDGVPVRQGEHIEWYRSADSDEAGYLYVTWSDCRTGTRDIYAQKYDTAGNALWTPQGLQIVGAAGRQEDPVIVADGSGGAIIAWVDVVADPKCNVCCQRVDSGGNLAWPAAGVVLNNTVSAHSPINISADGWGGAVIAWVDVRSDDVGDIYAIRVTAEGTVPPGWTANGTIICNAPGEQGDASSGSDGSGGALIAWKDKRQGTNYDLYAQRISGSGGLLWESGGAPVCLLSGDQDQVKLWSDGEQGAIIAWRDRRGGTTTDIYAQRVNGSGEMLWTDQGAAICAGGGNQEEPRLINDGAGGAVFTWKDHRHNPYDWDLYAQRVDAAGLKLWSADDVPVCTAANDQIEVRLTLAGPAEAVFVWVDQRSESSPLGDLYAQRINSSGLVQWAENGLPVCLEPLGQFSPILRSDGGSGVYAVWGDNRSGSAGIYAQRITADGSLPWASTGRAVMAGISGNATHIRMTAGSGGAIMAWEDGRRGSLGTSICAQRMDSDGSPLWASNGIGVDTSAGGSQTMPVVADDGSGGAFFAWEDRRDGIMQIYTQYFSADGVPLWPEAVRLCATDNDQTDPQMAPDGLGGAVITWSDLRDGEGYDIYIQRVDSQGHLHWAPDGVWISTHDDSGQEFYGYGIARTADGGFIALWQGGSWNRQDIYAGKVTAGGDIFPGWPEGGMAVCAAAGLQDEPILIPDTDGGALVVWEDSRQGAKDIYAQKIDAGGSPAWTVAGSDSLNGLPVCQAQNDQSSPSAAGNSQTGYCIAWHDFRNFGQGSDIYIQRVSAAGAALWEPDGVALASLGGDQFYPALVAGSDGATFTVWEDNRSAASIQDIYAQKLDESGHSQWTAQGISVISYAQKQVDPQIAGDGQGGAFIVWEDMRSKGKADTHDIYAQRLSGASTGLRGDPTNDGKINVLDVLAALNHILNIIPLDAGGQWRADCSGDGLINVLDALGIANVILGLGICAP